MTTNEAVAAQPYYRELEQADYQRMRVPRRYWGAHVDLISDARVGGAISPRALAQLYIERMPQMRKVGRGLVIYGPNGTGKTCIAVCLAFEFRRRGAPGLFLEAATLRSMIIEHEIFEDDQLLIDRARAVPVLILDDLGKGIEDNSGFGLRAIDELIRHRSAAQRITFITTNYGQPELRAALMPSTISALKEHCTAVAVLGEDRRDETYRRQTALLREQR